MSTAIFRTYTSEGFVIAADGLRLKLGDPNYHKEDVQKIFPIEDENKTLAFGLAGCIYTSNDDVAAFDFSVEADKAAKALTTRRPADLTRYAELFSGIINKSLAAAKREGRIAEYPTCSEIEPTREPGSRIAELVFVGYYERRPSWTDVRFWHDNQKLKPAQIYSERMRPGQLKICGSRTVSDLLYAKNDPRFDAFRRPAPPNQEDLALSEAIIVAESYIRACSSEVGRQVDENCASIGGHIHIATITPVAGFQWVGGFEPMPEVSDR
jgi:hypothetical protein